MSTRTPFFNSPARIVALQREAASWVGTPFHPHASLKRGGVDCIWLAAKIYQACGVIKEFKPPGYTMDGGHHNALSQVIQWLEASGRFEQVWKQGELLTLQPGDLLCFQAPKTIHHVGLVLSPRNFIHVVFKSKVSTPPIDDPTWRDRLTVVFRPVE